MLKINSRGMVEGVAVRPTPNKSGTIRPSLIVVHDTAGNIDNDSSIDWLCNPQARASAHFVIDRNGKITQLASCEVNCWHAGKSVHKGRQGCNNFSIGIEHVNPGKMLAGGRTAWGKVYSDSKYGVQQASTPHHGAGYWMPYTEAQLKSSLELCLAIRDHYGFTEVAPHWEISPGRKVDTNPLFPLGSFRGRMEGRQDEEFLLRVLPGAILRRWPSFNASNRLNVSDDDGWFRPNKSGVYPVSGTPDEFPAELLTDRPKDQLWYQVLVERKGEEDTLAWVWAGHVKEDRP